MSPKLLNILLVMLPAVIYLGYLSPAYTGEGGLFWTPEKSVKQLQGENVQYADTLKIISDIQKAGEDINKQYQAIDQEVLKNISIMLPDSIDPIRLRNEVINMTNSAGIAAEGLKVEKDRLGEGNAGFYRVTFSINARYRDFKEFMKVLEKNKRFLVLERASISRPKIDKNNTNIKEVDESVLSISLTFKVYYLK